MKQNLVFIASLALLSLLTGYLLSAISFIGKTGINLFYQQYKFLKIWWKDAALVFLIWIVLFVVLNLINKKVNKKNSTLVLSVFLLTAIAGLFLSYTDFRNSLSHRWLGERFHLGVYLFWLTLMMIAVFFLLKKKFFHNNTITKKSV